MGIPYFHDLSNITTELRITALSATSSLLFVLNVCKSEWVKAIGFGTPREFHSDPTSFLMTVPNLTALYMCITIRNTAKNPKAKIIVFICILLKLD